MPPRLGAVLAELGAGASPGEFSVVESLLGRSWSGLSDVRGDPAASADATDLTSGEVTQWLSGLPVRPGVEIHVASTPDRIGARMSLETFAANIDDLWFPAADDIVCALHSDDNRMVLVLVSQEYPAVRANASLSAAMRAARSSGGQMNARLPVLRATRTDPHGTRLFVRPRSPTAHTPD